MGKEIKYIKEKVLMCMLFTLIFIQIMSFTHFTHASPLLSVKVLRYSPSPAIPGKYVDVWLILTNEGDEPAKDVKLSFINTFPFSIVNGEQKEYNISELPPKESLLFKFRVLVDKDAVIGLNYAYVAITTNSKSIFNTSIKEKVPIEVKESREAINLINYSYDMEKAYPGGEIKLTLFLKNDGNEDVHSITLSLDLSSTPFIPLGVPSTISIPYMPSGAIKQITLPLSINTNTEVNDYLLPVEIKYVNNDGEEKSINYNIGIKINKPVSYIISTSPTYMLCDEKNEIEVRIDNNGISDMKFVTITLEGKGIEILSNKKVYVGNIESDDYGSATYTLLCSTSGVNKIKAIIEYRDERNTFHRDVKELEIKAYSSDQIYQLELKKRSYMKLFLGLLLAIILLYIFFKKYLKKVGSKVKKIKKINYKDAKK